MNNNRTWLIIVGALIVVVLVALVAWQFNKNAGGGPSAAGPASPGALGPGGASATKLPVPAGTTVPGVNSSVSADVAKPQMITPQAGGFNVRYFNIQVQNDKFTPDTVIVYVNDDVYLNLLAVDKNYDFKQPDNGYYLALLQGQKKVLHGQFLTPGKFIFYCQSCGGPAKGPVGYIVVAPKQ